MRLRRCSRNCSQRRKIQSIVCCAKLLLRLALLRLLSCTVSALTSFASTNLASCACVRLHDVTCARHHSLLLQCALLLLFETQPVC